MLCFDAVVKNCFLSDSRGVCCGWFRERGPSFTCDSRLKMYIHVLRWAQAYLSFLCASQGRERKTPEITGAREGRVCGACVVVLLRGLSFTSDQRFKNEPAFKRIVGHERSFLVYSVDKRV